MLIVNSSVSEILAIYFDYLSYFKVKFYFLGEIFLLDEIQIAYKLSNFLKVPV